MKYRETNLTSLGDAIREMLDRYKLNNKYTEAGLINSWEGVVGSMIAKHTVNLRIYNRRLFVQVDSAALRNELTYAREKIKKALNKEAGRDLIDEIIFK